MWTALVPVMLIFSSAAMAHDYGGYHNSDMMWGGGWAGMGFGLIVMIVVIAAVVALIVLLVRWLGGPGHGDHGRYMAPHGKTALDILKERFARGEIDKEEFEERRRTLGD